VKDEALPVVLGYFANGDRLVVGIGDVVTQFDRLAGVIHIAQAIEAGIEGADKIALCVVYGGRKPALRVIAKLFAECVVADKSAYRGNDVDKRDCKENIEERCACDIAQRPQPGIESHPVEKHLKDAERQEH